MRTLKPNIESDTSMYVACFLRLAGLQAQSKPRLPAVLRVGAPQWHGPPNASNLKLVKFKLKF